MDGKVVCLWHIHRLEWNATIHQGTDESEVSGKPIQFGNEQSCLLHFAGMDGNLQFGAGIILPAFHFGEYISK